MRLRARYVANQLIVGCSLGEIKSTPFNHNDIDNMSVLQVSDMYEEKGLVHKCKFS